MKKTFVDYAIPSQKLKHTLHQDPGWIALEPAQGELLDKTCEFIAGVLSGRDSAWNELTSLQHLASSLNLLTVKVAPAPPLARPIDALAARGARVVPSPDLEQGVADVLNANRLGGAIITSA